MDIDTRDPYDPNLQLLRDSLAGNLRQWAQSEMYKRRKNNLGFATTRRVPRSYTRRYGRRKGRKYYKKKLPYKQTAGALGGKNAHNISTKKHATVVKRKKPKKKKVPSNATLAKKVRKLEHKTRLSKYYVHVQGEWTKRAVGDNQTFYFQTTANSVGRLQDHLRNVPYSSTHEAAIGATQPGHQMSRFNRTSLITGDSHTGNWVASVDSSFEFKNVCTIPLKVSIYWCTCQKGANRSPMDYMESSRWRNRFYFTSVTDKNLFSTTAGAGGQDKEIITPGVAQGSQLAYPSHNKDLVNTWKPKRVYHGTVEPASHVKVNQSVGAIIYSQHRYTTWDAFATNGIDTYVKNTKPAFWLVRVEGIDVLDNTGDQPGATNIPHGTSSGEWIERTNYNFKLTYKVPGTTIVNHDHIDESNNSAHTFPRHPGRALHDNAVQTTPEAPPGP
jgi:hypothetical protein